MIEHVQLAPAWQGEILVLAPHYDDETLGCGGWLAGFPFQRRVRVIFVCDGRGSPGLRRRAFLPSEMEIGAMRRAEAEAALEALGLTRAQMQCWEFPDGSLARRAEELAERLRAELTARPCQLLLIPFRFDRHADHEALNRVGRHVARFLFQPPMVREYFVYYRRRLFPEGDIRRLVVPGFLIREELNRAQREAKRKALACYRTQTEAGPWGPSVLSQSLIEEVVAGPECFLCVPPGIPPAAIWRWPWWRIGMSRAIEKAALLARSVWRRSLE